MSDRPNALERIEPPRESVRRQRERMRQLLAESITAKEVLAVKQRLLDLALDGDLEAIKEFLSRAAGRPAADDDAVDAGPVRSLSLTFTMPPEIEARLTAPPPPRTIDVDGRATT